MFTKISVLVPTRGRIDRLTTLLKSHECATNGNNEVELVFRVDDDDLDTQDYLLATRHNVIVGPRYRGYESMPRFFNEMTAAATGDIFMCGNDDMVFRTPRWSRLVLDEANKYRDGLFDIGVATLNETHYPFSIVSRLVTECLGFIWDPRIFWGDIYLRDVMAAFDRCVMLSAVQVDHDWAGYRPDRVYLEQLHPGEVNKDILRRDPDYWIKTHAPAVAAAVEQLKGLFVCV